MLASVTGRGMSGAAGTEYSLVTGIIAVMSIVGLLKYEAAVTRLAEVTAEGMIHEVGEFETAAPAFRTRTIDVAVTGDVAEPVPGNGQPPAPPPAPSPTPAPSPVAPPPAPSGCGIFGDAATLRVDGSRIARYDSIAFNGRSENITIAGTRVFHAGETYTIFVENLAPGATEFADGNLVTIYDASGTIVMPRTPVYPSGYASRSAGDEHLVIAGQKVVIDLEGFKRNGKKTYNVSDEKRNNHRGDNDGELDFTDVCDLGGA